MDRKTLALRVLDFSIGTLLALAVAGTALGFGGVVGWTRIGLVATAFLSALLTIIRMAVEGRFRAIRSPLIGLGMILLGLVFVQIVPLPQGIVGSLTSDPAQASAINAGLRQSISVERQATFSVLIQWICYLTLALVAAHFVTNEWRTSVLFGAIAGSLCVTALAGLMQVASGSSGLYGNWPTKGSLDGFAPNPGDLLRSPVRLEMHATALPVPTGSSDDSPDKQPASADARRSITWFTPQVLPDAALGGMASGHWFLAYAVLGLPLGVCLCLHLGQSYNTGISWQQALWYSRSGNLALTLGSMLLVAAFMTGLVAGWVLLAPVLVGLLFVILLTAGMPHLRTGALTLGGLVLAAVLAGRLGAGLESTPDGEGMPISPVNSAAASLDWPVWGAATRIFADYKVLGCGFGSFSSVYPLKKTTDSIVTVADSVPLTFAAEGGMVGVVLLGAMILYILVKMPGRLARVGIEGRALAAGLAGAVLSLLLFSAVHWSIELPAVAVAVSVAGGVVVRWLAGGSDLFLESA